MDKCWCVEEVKSSFGGFVSLKPEVEGGGNGLKLCKLKGKRKSYIISGGACLAHRRKLSSNRFHVIRMESVNEGEERQATRPH